MPKRSSSRSAWILALSLLLLLIWPLPQGIRAQERNCPSPTLTLEGLERRSDCVDGYLPVTCPSEDRTLEGLSRRLDCLDASVSAIISSDAQWERALLKVYADMIVSKTEIIPPVDNAVTTAYDGVGNAVSFDCVPPLVERDGLVIFGAQLGEEQEIGRYRGSPRSGAYRGEPGCSREPHCRYLGSRYCVRRARSAGCYVSPIWIEWLKNRPATVLTYETVCEP